MSTAIYFYFKTKGYNVIADLSYFDSKHRIAIPGINGEMSHWKWEMTCYGISKDNFDIGTNVFHNMPLLSDGVVKHKLGVNALKSSTIKNFLDIEKNDTFSEQYRKSELLGEQYLCLHVRRGDYLNVASHVISNESLDNIASQFSSLVDSILILSDSPVDINQFKSIVLKFENRIHIIDTDTDPVFSHSLMRNASILICSNSQFSLSAGLLSRGLVVIPKTWHSPKFKRLNQKINEMTEFSIVKY